MIEESINNLTAAVDRLTAAITTDKRLDQIEALVAALQAKTAPIEDPAPAPPSPPAPAPAPAPHAPTSAAKEPTADEYRDKIRSVGRQVIDKHGAAKFKEVVQAGGAENVSLLPAENLASVLANLEGIL